MLASPTSSSPTRAPARPTLTLSALVVASGLLAALAGIVAHGLWREVPLGRFGESLLLAGLVSVLAWPLTRLRLRWAEALACVWLAACALMGGLLPAMAVALVVLSALAAGSCLAGGQRPLASLLCGLALFAGALGWLLPLPVHRTWVYAAACIALVALRFSAVRESAQVAWRGWRDAVEAAPRAAAWAVTVAGVASAAAWLPTMQHDDLAYHLGLPWQLLLHGRYGLDPMHQVWALAPWAGDVLQAMAQVLARAEARGALNAVWFVLALAALWRLVALLDGPAWLRWAAVALYASVPLTSALLGGMQTETPAVAVTLGLALLALDTQHAARQRWFVGTALFGLLWALKLLHGLCAVPLFAWLCWRLRGNLGAGTVLAGAALALAIGGVSYAYAWIFAGNPVLPLLNDVFGSPYMAPQAFDDPRWHAGLGIDTLWRMSFQTAAYHEGWAGAAGLLYPALAGAWLLALWQRPTRALAVCAGLAIVVPLLPLQYARYLQPGLALLIPAAVIAAHRALPPRAVGAALAALCVAQLAFQANAQWFLHTGAIKRSVAALGRDAPLFTRYVPERLIAQRIRAEAPTARVLVLDTQAPYYAEFAGAARTAAWYDPPVTVQATAAESDASGAAWAALLRRAGITDVILRPATRTAAQAAALRTLGAQQVPVEGDGKGDTQAQWWRLPPGGRP